MNSIFFVLLFLSFLSCSQSYANDGELKIKEMTLSTHSIHNGGELLVTITGEIPVAGVIAECAGTIDSQQFLNRFSILRFANCSAENINGNIYRIVLKYVFPVQSVDREYFVSSISLSIEDKVFRARPEVDNTFQVTNSDPLPKQFTVKDHKFMTPTVGDQVRLDESFQVILTLDTIFPILAGDLTLDLTQCIDNKCSLGSSYIPFGPELADGWMIQSVKQELKEPLSLYTIIMKVPAEYINATAIDFIEMSFMNDRLQEATIKTFGKIGVHD